jgi:1-phosphatidylinositol-3-phosphate 5-kinase
MDENLLKVARERPFYIRKDKNPEFYSSIHRDTNFLTKHSMMDYSLLVGIDADTDDLVLVLIFLEFAVGYFLRFRFYFF